jgi:F-type H+-transporting ATPase subunit alpha
LSRGERLVELLKQGQYEPMDVVDQVISIFAGTKGLFDSVETSNIQSVEKSLLEYIKSSHSALIEDIKAKKEITSENQEKLSDIIIKFVKEQA